MRLLTLALPLLHLSIAAAATTTYTISHRLLPHHPASTSEPDVFQKYGTISLPDDSTSILRIDRSEGGGGNVGGGSGGGWYQVLITGEGLGEGIMSSTKGCYLNAGSPSIVVHRHNHRLTGVEIIPHSSIPTDGSCPPISDRSTTSFHLVSDVSIKEPHHIFGPDLAPPMPINTAGPGGGPAQPVEEKSFLQKYWLPLLGLGFFVVSQLAPDDKTQQPAAAART